MSKPATYELLEHRIAQLGNWLDDESPYVRFDQRHLDPGTPEQAYWHLGYVAALRDALALMQSEGDGAEAVSPQSPRDADA